MSFQLSWTVKSDMSGVVTKLRSLKTNSQLGQFGANTLARYMEQFIPRRLGNLRRSAVIKPWKVTYTSPYAKYQYYGQYTNYTTGGTGSHWADKVNVGDLARAMSDEIKRIL